MILERDSGSWQSQPGRRGFDSVSSSEVLRAIMLYRHYIGKQRQRNNCIKLAFKIGFPGNPGREFGVSRHSLLRNGMPAPRRVTQCQPGVVTDSCAASVSPDHSVMHPFPPSPLSEWGLSRRRRAHACPLAPLTSLPRPFSPPPYLSELSCPFSPHLRNRSQVS